MLKGIILGIVVLLLCLICIGCTSAGLNRTPLDKWSLRSFEDLGIELMMPDEALFVETVGVKQWKTSGSGWRTLSFNLHTWSTGGWLQEPLYLINFRFERLNNEQYSAFRQGRHALSHYWIWKDHHSQEYTNVTHFVWRDLNREVMGWRRDYVAKNGDVVVCGVGYFPIGTTHESLLSDSNAIERVLGSIIVH